MGVQETTTTGLDLDPLGPSQKARKEQKKASFRKSFLQLSRSYGEHWSFGAAMESVGIALDNIKRARYLRVSGL